MPQCPICKGPLKEVLYPSGSMLNREQFQAIRAGDFYCESCKGTEAASGYKYFWKKDLATAGYCHESTGVHAGGCIIEEALTAMPETSLAEHGLKPCDVCGHKRQPSILWREGALVTTYWNYPCPECALAAWRREGAQQPTGTSLADHDAAVRKDERATVLEEVLEIIRQRGFKAKRTFSGRAQSVDLLIKMFEQDIAELRRMKEDR